jgi:hypothetical protein
MSCIEVCKGACCRDIQLSLSKSEYQYLADKGANIWPKDKPNSYELRGYCPLFDLTTNRCIVHGTRKQPLVCKHLVTYMGTNCRTIRRNRPEFIKAQAPQETDPKNSPSMVKEMIHEVIVAVASLAWPE